MNSTSNSASISCFPQELIDKVIEDIETDVDILPVTLRACALVCRSFLRASQIRIFSRIELDSYYPARYVRLHQVLLESPHIRLYIHSVEIVHDAYNWGANTPILISIFGMLHMLTSFVCRNLEWSKLPRAMRTAICALCARPGIVSLRLVQLWDFTEMDELVALAGSSTLKYLVLEDTLLPALNGGATGVRSSMIGSAFAHLRRLVLVCSPRTISQVQKILDASASSLEELKLRMEETSVSEFPSNQDTLVLEHMRALRFIQLMFFMWPEESVVVMPWLAALLQGPTGLAEIVLLMRLWDTPNHPIPQIAWEPLAVMQLPSVRRLSIKIAMPRRSFEQIFQAIIDHAERELQRLQRNGVCLNFGVWDRTSGFG
ncbi:hypothetical protein B0H17DRAFT_1047410 [Mycena rosella]|uniref:Uncharacterized protein n=1 Tax=Mycena rosella TaxID=1033263 RepID=A0AAD7DW93_MYCRO|nr:hypothetical protein B0H17DRAFT_1047410 [Mycena rosella]